ncbi:hypothetical protein D3C72_1774700 [compost metagenome]
MRKTRFSKTRNGFLRCAAVLGHVIGDILLIEFDQAAPRLPTKCEETVVTRKHDPNMPEHHRYYKGYW